jgi:type 2 lantibiotic biosynthesis protein LanM
MDSFYDRLIERAATIDDLLSDDFEAIPGDKDHAGFGKGRLAAWCQSAAGGNWPLFERRLRRDGLDSAAVSARLTAARRKPSLPTPQWAADATWILPALEGTTKSGARPARAQGVEAGPVAFEHLLTGVVESAEALQQSGLGDKTAASLKASAYNCLRHALLTALSELAAPPLYERFAAMRDAAGTAGHRPASPTSLYEKFVAETKAGGFRQLFDEKPVLLRLISTIVRQWIETSREFIQRLDADLPLIRSVVQAGGDGGVVQIEGGFSDPHNGGRSVKIVIFADGSKVVYKPKDLRVDVVWQKLLDHLNSAAPPVELRTARALARDGYGWTECIDHSGCATSGEFKVFFSRVGAWLALFHCFAANDMHQENIVAAGTHPVPIDLETILQSSSSDQKLSEPEDAAFDAATEKLANSVMATGLLPAYGRGPDGKVFAMGGVTADWNTKIRIKWENINSNDMRPTRWKEVVTDNPNLPHVNGLYAKFSDHIEELIAGFDAYARFLLEKGKGVALFDGFSGLAVRKVVRATRFYAMLLQRLKNHKTMGDGVTWSAQADFGARLADWDTDDDPLWPVQRAERCALLTLNIPHFVSTTDGQELKDEAGFRMRLPSTDGLARARTRFAHLDRDEIDWQVKVIKINTNSLVIAGRPLGSPARRKLPELRGPTPSDLTFRSEAQRAVDELTHNAIRRGQAAAWIGLDWLGDAEVFQLVTLGPDLYNGTAGLSFFLSAHAAVTGQAASRELALAGVARIRKQLKSRNAARIARSLGLGGATGLGSIVYALTVMSENLRDPALRDDAHRAAGLMTDELIAADKRLDVIAGSAGGILCLLRLYRDEQSEMVLHRAIKCGEHLLAQDRLGEPARRSWVGQGLGSRPLNGMSHGAAGFAYALASLSAVTGREDFAAAAQECLDFEDSTFNPQRGNWPDLRVEGGDAWPCQWCHGAPGIGLGRIGMARLPKTDGAVLKADVQGAVEGTRAAWPSSLDTLCCGTMGSVEFLCEAGDLLGRGDLLELARRELAGVLQYAADTGDYRWNSGERRFNLGLFRGIAGVGYTALRQVDPSLPNVLIFE